jgi:hypothetical protein
VDTSAAAFFSIGTYEMSVGGQSSKQNNTSNNAYSGSTSGATTDTTIGSVNNTSTSTTTPVAPDGFVRGWNAFTPGAGGFTATQQPGVDFMTGQLGSLNPNQGRAGIDLATGYLTDALKHRGAPTLAALAASGNSAYAAPADVTAQQIAARRGSEFMSDYQTPLTSEYVDASLADYDQGAAEARNSLRAGNAGAFGNKRFGVAEGQFASDAALGRGQLSSGLRLNAFNTAAGLGMQDANRFLSADTTNASNKLAADTFNSNMLNNRQQFDANLGMQYNDQRDRLAGNIANMGNSEYALGQGIAGGLINAGGMGQNQNLAWLNAGTPLIGQSNTSSNTGTTNQSSTGTTTGNTSGNSSGTSRGGSSSKGGGFEIGPIKLGG